RDFHVTGVQTCALPISASFGSETRDVILFTPTGGTIRARTPNQARLVEAARTNDLIFAIGPAGTGKTYTAVALAVAALKSRQVKIGRASGRERVEKRRE